MDRLEQVGRRAEAHQVARPRIVGQQRDGDVERGVALRRRLVAGQPADADPVERQRGDEPRRRGAQVRLEAALDDPEQRLVRAGVRGERALRPAMRPLGRVGDDRPRRRRVDRLVEGDRDVGPERLLDRRSRCSGVNRWSDPSRWLRNVTPSSSTTRRSPSETTWKPPESVRIGPSQSMNRCRPPSRSIRSWPGRRYRW